MNVPTEAMIQKTFCQRKVVLMPAMRITVIRAIIEKPPTKIQTPSVWKLVPHVDEGLVLEESRRASTRTGPEGEDREVARPEGRADHRREGGAEVAR